MRTAIRAAIFAAAFFSAAAARGETIVKPLVEVGSEARYDDDPYMNGKQEIFSKISPKLGALLANEDLKLQGWYAADVMYKAIQQVPEVDHRGQLKLDARPTDKLTVRADAQLWRVQDPTSLPRLGIAAVPVPILYSTASAGLTWQVAQRWYLDVDDKQEFAKIYAHNLPFSVTQTPSAGFQYALSARDRFTGTYRYQAFLAWPSLTGQTHAALFGLNHQFTHTWHGYLRGGPLAYVNDRQGGGTAVVPVGEGGIGWSGEYSEVDLVGGHDLVGSAGYAAAVWTDYVQLGWAYHPTKPLTLYLGAGAFRNGIAPAQASNIEGYSLGGGAAYAFNREWQLALNLQRLQQSANEQQDLIQLNRNIAGVRLTWTPEFAPKGL